MYKFTIFFVIIFLTTTDAVCPNSCSGNGTCNAADICTCYDQGKVLYFGKTNDPTKGRKYEYTAHVEQLGTHIQKRYTGADCSQYTCARGISWNKAEISNRSYCGDLRFDTEESCTHSCIKTSGDCAVAPIGVLEDKGGASLSCVLYGYTTELACETESNTMWTAEIASRSWCSLRSLDAVSENECEYFGGTYDAAAEAPNPVCTTNLITKDSCEAAFGEWKDRAWHIDQLQTHVDNVECSDAGLCDRTTGVCNCFAGYEGSACQRATCENECSGHGICQSNMQFAKDALARYQDSWDSGNHYGCKCDSGYRGPDCSMKECPSSDDPLLFHGNNQGRDCSGRGVCDYAIGLCTCFSGYTGEDCSKVEALA